MCGSGKKIFRRFCFFSMFAFFSLAPFDRIGSLREILLIFPAHADQSTEKDIKAVGKSGSTLPDQGSMQENSSMVQEKGGMHGKGGMMKKMVESGCCPDSFQPQLYPSLVAVSEPSQESLDAFEKLSLMRMSRGYELLSESLNRLSAAVRANDLTEVRNAHEQLRAGYEKLTSGIATYVKLVEGEPPREIGLHWFQQALNIDYSSPFYHRKGFLGMNTKHWILCAIMIAGCILAIIAYTYRMHKVKVLFKKLSTSVPEPPPTKGAPLRTAPPQNDKTPDRMAIKPPSTPEPEKTPLKSEKDTATFLPEGSVPDEKKDPTPSRSQTEQDASATDRTVAEVTFSESGKHAPLPPDATVLDVAESVDVEIENVCRQGICGMCKVKLLQGHVSMECDESLTEEEKNAGLILACQAKSDEDITVKA